MNTNNDPSIGHTIATVIHDKSKDTLTITDSQGTQFVYSVTGDCCSSSWIEHITIPSDIEGATILSLSAPSLPSHDGTVDGAHENYEDLAIYHTAWQTTKGEIIAEYRNSSNGYYGGWMNDPQVIRPT